MLDWLRVEYAIEKPSSELLAVTDLDSDTWVAEVKRIRGKKLPLTAAGVQGLREEYTRSIEPALALAAETLKLERTLSDLVNRAYALGGIGWRRALRAWAKAEAALRLRSFHPYRPQEPPPPANDPAVGEHRHKLGKDCLLTPRPSVAGWGCNE